MDECAFCQIIAGDRESYILYEDDTTAAFLDNNPVAHGHSLVVPRAHREHLFSEDESAPFSIFETVQRVSMAIDRTLDPDGFSLFYTSGPLVGTVSHAHIHIVPRYEDDNIQLGLARGSLEDKSATRFAERIRDKLK